MNVVFNELYARVTGYLTTVRQTLLADDEAALVIARTELPGIVDAFEALFSAHSPDENGWCQGCRTGWRRRKAPCRVFIEAQLALFHNDSGRHALI